MSIQLELGESLKPLAPVYPDTVDGRLARDADFQLWVEGIKPLLLSLGLDSKDLSKKAVKGAVKLTPDQKTQIKRYMLVENPLPLEPGSNPFLLDRPEGYCLQCAGTHATKSSKKGCERQARMFQVLYRHAWYEDTKSGLVLDHKLKLLAGGGGGVAWWVTARKLAGVAGGGSGNGGIVMDAAKIKQETSQMATTTDQAPTARRLSTPLDATPTELTACSQTPPQDRASSASPTSALRLALPAIPNYLPSDRDESQSISTEDRDQLAPPTYLPDPAKNRAIFDLKAQLEKKDRLMADQRRDLVTRHTDLERLDRELNDMRTSRDEWRQRSLRLQAEGDRWKMERKGWTKRSQKFKREKVVAQGRVRELEGDLGGVRDEVRVGLDRNAGLIRDKLESEEGKRVVEEERDIARKELSEMIKQVNIMHRQVMKLQQSTPPITHVRPLLRGHLPLKPSDEVSLMDITSALTTSIEDPGDAIAAIEKYVVLVEGYHLVGDADTGLAEWVKDVLMADFGMMMTFMRALTGEVEHVETLGRLAGVLVKVACWWGPAGSSAV